MTNQSMTATLETGAFSQIWEKNPVGDQAKRETTGRPRAMVWDDTVTDEQLMLACQRGKNGALEAIYQRHFRHVFLFIVRLIQNRELAEDLAQETFLRVYKHRDSWQPNAKFTSWMYRIARNLCIDEKRRYWNRMVHSESQMKRNADAEDMSYMEQVEDSGSDAREAFSAKIDEDTIKQAINQLSDEQREVIILNKYQGMSYGEIAEVLGSSPESIKQRAYRAHLKLRSILEPLLKEYI